MKAYMFEYKGVRWYFDDYEQAEREALKFDGPTPIYELVLNERYVTAKCEVSFAVTRDISLGLRVPLNADHETIITAAEEALTKMREEGCVEPTFQIDNITIHESRS